MKPPAFEQEHRMLWGGEIGLPLVDNYGYNDWHKAGGLSWHSHSGYELLFLLEGSATYEFQDGPVIEVSGGEFFPAAPYLVHRGAQDVEAPSKICWIVFDPGQPGAYGNTNFEPPDFARILMPLNRQDRRVFRISPFMRTLLHAFRDAVTDPEGLASPFSMIRARSILCQLILESAMVLSREPSPTPIDYVDVVKRRMERDYALDLNIDGIAEDVGMSRNRLYAVFKDAIGQTPHDYLTRLRVKHAQQRLSESDQNLTDIAMATGFNSSQYFSKVFRKYTGQTPMAYRSSRSAERSVHDDAEPRASGAAK